jgi:hypothetical protein
MEVSDQLDRIVATITRIQSPPPESNFDLLFLSQNNLDLWCIFKNILSPDFYLHSGDKIATYA